MNEQMQDLKIRTKEFALRVIRQLIPIFATINKRSKDE
jgi:hypothetical protein